MLVASLVALLVSGFRLFSSAFGTYEAAFVFGLVFGLVAGYGFNAAATAWPSYVLARGWLALRHRLPWRLMRFLADAHRRGVLRQAGAVSSSGTSNCSTARQPGGGQAVGRASLAVRQRGDLRMSGGATTSSAGALVHSHRGRPGERSEDRSGLSVAVIASATWPAASASAADTSAAAESIGAAATTASR